MWWNDEPAAGATFSHENAKKKGAWLRAQTINHLRKHKADLLLFFDQHYRGKTFDEWLVQASESEYWVNGMLLQGVANKLGAALIIFRKADKGSWQRFCVAPRFNAAGYACAAQGVAPIVLTLEQKHNKSLRAPRGAEVPDAWLREGCDVWKSNLEGGGIHKGQMHSPATSKGTPSVHSLIHASWSGSCSVDFLAVRPYSLGPFRLWSCSSCGGTCRVLCSCCPVSVGQTCRCSSCCLRVCLVGYHHPLGAYHGVSPQQIHSCQSKCWC